MVRAWVSMAMVWCCACGFSPGDPQVRTQRDGIIGGTISLGDPAVVAFAALTPNGDDQFCTGTLIGIKTVLTAAHCLDGMDPEYAVLFGPYADTPTHRVRVAERYAHPQYSSRALEWDYGLLRLEEGVLDVAPIPFNELPLNAAQLGRPIRHVGFGLTAARTSGVRYEITHPVRQFNSHFIEAGEAGSVVCSGDSGGPGLMVLPGETKEQLVGVINFGSSGCSSQGFDGRVDIVAPWIRQVMAGWEPPSCGYNDGCVPGCMPVDQDCACVSDGVCGLECRNPARDADCPFDCRTNRVCATERCGHPDADCVNEGEHCDAALQCRGRLCLDDPQRSDPYCTSSCASSSSACPAMMECAEGRCRFPQRPVRQLLETCTASADFCANGGVCTGPVGGFTRCVTGCIDRSDCASGSSCEAGVGSLRYCRPAGLAFKNPTVPLASMTIGPAAPKGCSTSAGSLGLGLAVMLLFHRPRRARLP